MTNADKFQQVFGIYATELWAKPEKEFLEWLNASAEPERKKGKWMLCNNQRREDMLNDNYMYTCTNCLHSDLHSKSVVVPYCWYCGADMRGEEDE